MSEREPDWLQEREQPEQEPSEPWARREDEDEQEKPKRWWELWR